MEEANKSDMIVLDTLKRRKLQSIQKKQGQNWKICGCKCTAAARRHFRHEIGDLPVRKYKNYTF